jgi:hypothetical protein
MAYVLKLYVKEQLIETDDSGKKSFDDLMSRVKQLVDCGIADCGEVFDSDGHCCFRYRKQD